MNKKLKGVKPSINKVRRADQEGLNPYTNRPMSAFTYDNVRLSLLQSIEERERSVNHYLARTKAGYTSAASQMAHRMQECLLGADKARLTELEAEQTRNRGGAI